MTALCFCAQGQSTPAKDGPANEAKGMAPRLTPADYQAQAQAGMVTIGAEFLGHGVPTTQGVFSTEDFVVVETGFFGPPEARIKLASDDFSIRINGKKTTSPSQPFAIVAKSLKDPEWEPPVPTESKQSKTSFGGGGKGGQGDSSAPPIPPRMPIALQRVMEQRVQKTLLAEGDRALPQAGLIFFPYKGKADSIHSIELIYAGDAGKATLTLQP